MLQDHLDLSFSCPVCTTCLSGISVFFSGRPIRILIQIICKSSTNSKLVERVSLTNWETDYCLCSVLVGKPQSLISDPPNQTKPSKVCESPISKSLQQPFHLFTTGGAARGGAVRGAEQNEKKTGHG